MRTRLLIFVTVFLAGLLAVRSVPASAHVLIPDTTRSTGAIVHFAPNDDPIAYEPTGIFYDVQTGTDLKDADLSLVIRSADGGIEETIPLEVEDRTSVLGSFIFPIRGLYQLTLTVSPKTDGTMVEPMIFRHTLRIVKSQKGNDPAPPVPAWVTSGLILSVWLIATLVIILIQRRKDILRQSR